MIASCLCIHCQKNVACTRFAGLCRPCYLDTTILSQYVTLCRHCRQRIAARGKRTLCRACHTNQTIRAQYAPVQACLSSNHEPDFFGGHELPAEPTSARPGTEEKIAVMAERVQQRVSLHHPLDGRVER